MNSRLFFLKQMWFASCGFYPHQLAPELCSYLGLMTNKLDDSKCDDGKIIGQVLKSEFHQLQPKKKKKTPTRITWTATSIRYLIARKLPHNNANQSILDEFQNTTKIHSLMERCVSWILLIEFLIWRNNLIIRRFARKKKYGLCLIN